MIDNVEYQRITKDIAGARTKSRFTYEMFYGIKIIYELYCEDFNDFFVIFDYACDIEVGKGEEINFYQLKTIDRNNYTLPRLLKNSPTKQSIFQTLINLSTSDSIGSLNIVSNNLYFSFLN